jgi:hypothetical protein
MTMSELVDTTDRVEMIGSMTADIVDQKQLAVQLLQQAEEDRFEVRALLQSTFSVPSPATLVPVAAASAQGLLARGHDETSIDSVIDRLVAQMPVRAVRPTPSQPPADLRRRPVQAELASDRGPQLLIDADPQRSWAPAPHMSLPMRVPRLVAAIGLAVAAISR